MKYRLVSETSRWDNFKIKKITNVRLTEICGQDNKNVIVSLILYVLHMYPCY